MKAFLFTAALPYLLKLLFFSGLLFGYYRLFLRDKVFHQYNRFYLLGASLASLLLPLVRLSLPASLPILSQGTLVSGAWHAIIPGQWHEVADAANSMGRARSGPDIAGVITGIYILTVLVALLIFLRQLRQIHLLRKRFPSERLGPIELFMTREPGTPFSFFKQLFWNREIDIDTERGRQILLHEWYHIRQRHTLDLLWLRSLLVFFWLNPFFYLIYREIRTIHEYLADRYAVAGGDRCAYAELLVWHSITERSLPIPHPFFQSSIKRRITMLTQSNVRKPGYSSRMMVAPLTFFLLCAFAVKERPLRDSLAPLTVVIDPGHGGADNGAVWQDAKEKDLNLALALKIKQLAPEYHLNVLLTRETDELSGGKSSIRASLEYRAEMANTEKADLFVSLHVDNSGGGGTGHGFNAWVSPNNTHYAQCTRLGSALIDAVKTSYPADGNIRQRSEGIYVLRNAAMPAVLLECGYIDNPEDLAFMRDDHNRETIARDILQGIRQYQEAQAAGK